MSKADTPQPLSPEEVEAIHRWPTRVTVSGEGRVPDARSITMDELWWVRILATIDNLQSTLDGLSEPRTSDMMVRVRGDKTGVRIEEYDSDGVIQDFVFTPIEGERFAKEMSKAAHVAAHAKQALTDAEASGAHYYAPALAAAQQQAGSPNKKSEE